MRELENDAALFDCDVFGPTFRAHKLLSEDEDRHLYATPNYDKLKEDVPLTVFENLIDFNFLAVREKGVIVMDGLGRHSEKTLALLKRARCLAVVCKSNLDDQEISSCNYKTNNTFKHPFEFYSEGREQVFRITTHEGEGNALADLAKLTAELYGLSRTAVIRGKVVAIPKSTCDTTRQIARYLLKNWF